MRLENVAKSGRRRNSIQSLGVVASCTLITDCHIAIRSRDFAAHVRDVHVAEVRAGTRITPWVWRILELWRDTI